MAEIKSSTAAPPYYGTVLKKGSRGPDTALVQSWLSQLPAGAQIGKIDGSFGDKTECAVKLFQNSAGLTTDGRVGPITWDALYDMYVEHQGPGEIYPGIPVRRGAVGAVVQSMQQRLTDIGKTYTAIPAIAADGKFGPASASALKIFQRLFGLSRDAVLGKKSFAALELAWQGIQAGSPVKVPAPYSGVIISQGSTGDSVRLAQSFLNGQKLIELQVQVDGRFGPDTRDAVLLFQQRCEIETDGKIGQITWDMLVQAFNDTL